MARTNGALLLCSLLLCVLEEASSSKIGRCANNRCVVLTWKRTDFEGAQRTCKNFSWTLAQSSPGEVGESLSTDAGEVWLELRGPGTNRSTCSYISMSGGGDSAVMWGPCGLTLDGFLCQYTFGDPCGVLRTDRGTQVRYTDWDYVDVSGSNSFPPGTIAVVEKVDVDYALFKFICFEKAWVRAPWDCDVRDGGCEHGCVGRAPVYNCTCPKDRSLHPNNVTCEKDPCEGCAQECRQVDGSYACACTQGYILAPDGKSCQDVDECAEDKKKCSAVGEECLNTDGGFECRCQQGFVKEVDGTCLDNSICLQCEHMLCKRVRGGYACACMEGYRVSLLNSTRCTMHCREEHCLAECDPNTDAAKADMMPCYCPDGYISHALSNGTVVCSDVDECIMEALCEHTCVNTHGSYRCFCQEGFERQGNACFKDTSGEETEDGSGSPPPFPTSEAGRQPALVPHYVKTGSVLGIAVFLGLCAVALCLLVRGLARRCGTFELSSLPRPDIDVFYLQQVSTETYKRLSLDRQIKQDPQRL